MKNEACGIAKIAYTATYIEPHHLVQAKQLWYYQMSMTQSIN